MGSLQKLTFMISKLDENDSQIIKQLTAILFKYLEKRGRI